MTSLWRHSRLTYYDLGPNFLAQDVKLLSGEVWQVSKRNSLYIKSYLRKTTGALCPPPPSPAGRGFITLKTRQSLAKQSFLSYRRSIHSSRKHTFLWPVQIRCHCCHFWNDSSWTLSFGCQAHAWHFKATPSHLGPVLIVYPWEIQRSRPVPSDTGAVWNGTVEPRWRIVPFCPSQASISECDWQCQPAPLWVIGRTTGRFQCRLTTAPT